MTAPARPALLSLEALSRREKLGGRARYGIRPRSRPRIVLDVSDLMLLVEADSLPADLEEATGLARGSLRVRSGERIGLYWELYGLSPGGETLAMSLTITKKSKSWLRRIGETLGLTGRDRPMSLNWLERVEARYPAVPRSLAIELPEMAKGAHLLRLQIEAYGREPVVVWRELSVSE